MEHVSWGTLVVFDLFLTGLGAGVLFLAAAADLFGGKRYQKITRIGACIAPWLVILGMIFWVNSLGNPSRFWGFFFKKGPGLFMFNPNSAVSVGVWLRAIFVIISLCYAFLSLFGWVFSWGEKLRRQIGVGALILATLVMVYTGVFLASTSNLLWHTAFLPAVFSVSAISTGIAGVVLVLALAHIYKRGVKPEPSIPKLEKINSWVIGLQLLIIILFLLSRIGSAPMKMIVGSGFGLLILWIAIVSLGLVVPLLFGINGKARGPRTSLAVSALVLLGGFFLRYVILIGGQI